MKSLFVLTLLLCISVGFALKCHVCLSSESMKDCDEKSKLLECGSQYDTCAKMAVDYSGGGITVKSFAKTCFHKSDCEAGNDAFKQCNKAGGGTCEFSCCDTDGCNGGTAPVVSVLLMVACAIMALFR